MHMFGYYLELALRSLKRSPGLTALMVLAIGFGVAASMTTYSVFRAVSGDPIPWKSSKLFVPQIDMWGPGGRIGASDASRRCAGLHRCDGADARPSRQAAIGDVPDCAVGDADRRGAASDPVDGYAVYSEFFPMLDVPFQVRQRLECGRRYASVRPWP
jgi:putative ABC transport system permease protein